MSHYECKGITVADACGQTVHFLSLACQVTLVQDSQEKDMELLLNHSVLTYLVCVMQCLGHQKSAGGQDSGDK